MQDRVPTKPNRALIRPEDGGAAFYATITRADEPTQPGDPMGKVTFLRDETAALFGLDETAVPDDALRVIYEKATRVVVGEYNGTGVYGVDNPNSLTFGFRPKLVIFNRGAQHSNTSSYGIKAGRGLSAFFGNGNNLLWVEDVIGNKNRFAAGVQNLTVTDTGIEWYSVSGKVDYDTLGDLDVTQLNASGAAYTYVAIG